MDKEDETTQAFTYIVHHRREELLALLPSRAIVGEIGVAEGDFSASILAQCSPTTLHLIDAWKHFDVAEYSNDPCNQPDEIQELRFESIRQRFAHDVTKGRILLHRMLSIDAASTFPSHHFDWVYLDAMHFREAVSADLDAFCDKVKPDGFICGHDYADHPLSRARGFGVIPAVNEFVMRNRYNLVAVTDELFPTYVIVKDAASPRFKRFQQQLLAHAHILKVENFLQKSFRQELCVDRQGKVLRSYCVIG